MNRPTSAAVLALLAATMLVVPAAAGPTATAAAPSLDGPSPAAGAAAPASGVASAPAPTDNTTARLTIPQYRIEQGQFRTVRIGVASSLQRDADGARMAHRRTAIERDFEAAEGVSEKRNAIDRGLIDLSNRADALRARERATTREYSNGNISAETAVRQFARIDASARDLRATLDLVRALTTRVGTSDFDGRIRDVEGDLVALQGPVRRQVALALAGDRSAVRVHVVGSDDALVLATLADGQYIREATNWRNRNASAQPVLDFGEVTSRVEQLYPWATSQRGATSVDWQGAGAWRFQARHSQGQLTASVDASTTDVYREVQSLSVDEMPTVMALVRAEDGVRVELQRTYLGGPLRILVEDAATDAVLNARVSVDGHELGHIGADGLVVTMEPRPPYTLNVTANGTTVSFTVERPFADATE